MVLRLNENADKNHVSRPRSYIITFTIVTRIANSTSELINSYCWYIHKMINENGATNNKANIITKLYPFGFWQDATELGHIAGLLCLSNLLFPFMITTVSIALMGSVGQAELNASTLAFAVCGLVGKAVTAGLNFGCDTLLPQYFSGKKSGMGIILQRGVLITCLGSLLSWSLMLNARYALRWIEHDPHVITLTNTFLQLYLPVVPLDAVISLLRMYLASCGRTHPIVIIFAIGNVIHIISLYICLYYLHIGLHAVPISAIVSYTTILLAFVTYIRSSTLYEETWRPVTRACLREWDTYLKLAVPGAFSIFIEYWSVGLSVLFVVNLGPDSLSAQVIVQQTIWFILHIMISISDAGNILIGRQLGVNQTQRAIQVKNVVYTLTLAALSITTCFVVLGRAWIPIIYNVPTSAQSLAQNALLLAAIVNIFEGLYVVQTGIIRACVWIPDNLNLNLQHTFDAPFVANLGRDLKSHDLELYHTCHK
ncbi:unnamed protein product [Adineta ricciae]|uniref:Multidrug and toxin extrusion protein n=2 Tax=Adineta ricciae TaxID=249248 RepID=A0A815SDL2_ADIRI|nr:unnamed protein product [Adineta ricciae]